MPKHRRVGDPRTGDGITPGKKPKKSQISQVWPTGTVMSKQTARLWGVFSGSTKRPK